MQAQPKYLIILLIFIQINNIYTYEVDVQQVAPIVESSKAVQFKLRATKISRSLYGISGTVENFIAEEKIDLYTMEVKIFRSSAGNNQFVLFPFKIPNILMREFFNGPYRKYIMEAMKSPVSDLPYTKDSKEDLVKQWRRGNFTIKKYLFDQAVLPKMLPNGLYKVMFIIKQNEDTVAGFYALATLY